MLIYGVCGTFAHKKTIKQFLQPMIEQVLGRGGVCRKDVPLFLGQFFKATIFFASVFSIHRRLFWVDFTNIYIFLLYRVSQEKDIDKKLLFGAAQGFNSQLLNLFGFRISVSFVWCII